MKTYQNGHRFNDYDRFESKLHQPYNYEKNGIIQHIVSRKIVDSPNRVLQAMLRFVNQSFVHLFKYTDELKYFKNYLWKNR